MFSVYNVCIGFYASSILPVTLRNRSLSMCSLLSMWKSFLSLLNEILVERQFSAPFSVYQIEQMPVNFLIVHSFVLVNWSSEKHDLPQLKITVKSDRRRRIIGKIESHRIVSYRIVEYKWKLVKKEGLRYLTPQKAKENFRLFVNLQFYFWGCDIRSTERNFETGVTK